MVLSSSQSKQFWLHGLTNLVAKAIVTNQSHPYQKLTSCPQDMTSDTKKLRIYDFVEIHSGIKVRALSLTQKYAKLPSSMSSNSIWCIYISTCWLAFLESFQQFCSIFCSDFLSTQNNHMHICNKSILNHTCNFKRPTFFKLCTFRPITHWTTWPKKITDQRRSFLQF